MKEALKVGVSGVRGVVGDSFTPQVATSFAQAFGTFVGRGAVVVGRDTRPSGVMIERAVVSGLLSVGCKPVLAGIVPTPTLLMLTKDLGARGGIAITASHNPSPWNALKFVDRTGLFLSETRANELFDIYHQQDFPLVPESEIPTVAIESDPMSGHFRRIKDYVDCAAVRKAGLKVAVDCCNGVGALHSVPFLKDMLGCEVVAIYDKPSGIFEREPEPMPKNLKLLCDTVVQKKCAIGFAQDPDGDRLAIVNEKGEPIGEDLTLAFAVQQVLARHGKGPVAVNLSSSKCVEYVANQFGSEVVRTKIGEINVSETMLRVGAVVGGESNGGVIIPAVHPCRDSFVGMAIVLEMMAETGKTVSELRQAIPRYFVVKDKIRIRAEQAPLVIRALRREYADREVNLLDGIYVDFGESWVHARRSNTEPVIRITAEARSEDEARRLAADLRSKVENAL
ncbi:MAG TPA: phosphoglucosamine mutase [Kiritimatiellia bacterium]|nr:phosphoglucosamine mutase [Kiritimatiellia bacterium]